MVLWLCSDHIFCLGTTSFPGCPSSLPTTPLPSPISLSFRAEQELGLGALCVVQQEKPEEVFVRSMELHFTLFPPDGGKGSMVKDQEPATPAKDKAFQPDPGVAVLLPPSYLWIQNPCL